MKKSLEQKLKLLQQDSSCNEFILADAKDADMAFGLDAPGCCSQTKRWRTLGDYRKAIRDVTEQGLIDICLMSASSCEALAIEEKLFDSSSVTPAVRANDSTDIWLAHGTGNYANEPSLPFRSADIGRLMQLSADQGQSPVKLGLYSITLNNDATLDRASLERFADFRLEARKLGFDYFLEVFPPNAPAGNMPSDVGRFICDSVARTLAGLTRGERPLFLKLPYLGPELTERLAAYDTDLILGIMGGSAGTTCDSFELLAEAKKYGVRAALFGRRINHAECQLTFVEHLRRIADGEIAPHEAVRSYHAELDRKNITPLRSLEADMECSSTGLAHY